MEKFFTYRIPSHRNHTVFWASSSLEMGFFLVVRISDFGFRETANGITAKMQSTTREVIVL